jgi:hypothetical protein
LVAVEIWNLEGREKMERERWGTETETERERARRQAARW